MTNKDLNLKLITAFPELQCETEWHDIGSHLLYGDVLVPVILAHLKSQNYEDAKKYFNFLDEFLKSRDAYATNVVAVSVIESIFFDEIDATKVKLLLGPETLKIWEGYEKFFRQYHDQKKTEISGGKLI